MEAIGDKAGGAAIPVEGDRRTWAILALVLAGTYLIMRLPGIMALPVFGDEAIYLRWAQLVRGEGVEHGHWWISLLDPKPPLHFWLLALVFRWTSDPLLSGRLLSAAAGVAGVPLMMAIGEELGFFIAKREDPVQPNGRMLGVVGALLWIFCPFLAFYQRLATADALFIGESLIIVWLSLRWGRLAVAHEAEKRAWITVLALGAAIGTGLLTRQGVSYTICALPLVAWGMHAWIVRKERTKSPWVRSGVQLLLAAVLAAVMWMPYLTAELQNQTSGADVMTVVKRRILYQDQFTADASNSRWKIVARNTTLAFVPTWNKGEPASGWFFFYLTPPLYFLCLGGAFLLVFRRQRALFFFLLCWTAVTLGPVILLGNVVYSRYVLAGVPPLLMAGAYLLTEATGVLLGYLPRHATWVWIGVLALWTAAIGWPMKALGQQAHDWTQQTLTARDRYQYITGWTAGFAAQHAIAYIKALAAAGPLIVITDGGWGTPADAIWVYASSLRNVQLYYVDDPASLAPQTNGTFPLKKDKWLYPAPLPVRLASADGNAIPILYITGGIVHADGKPDRPTAEVLQVSNPNLQLEKTFNGIEHQGKPEGEPVTMFSLHLTP